MGCRPPGLTSTWRPFSPRRPLPQVSVAATVRLLIIDEVHLLNDERGPVIETLVARTTRLVESTQSMIRIVGLSATLPNYTDVARFLGVGETGAHAAGAGRVSRRRSLCCSGENARHGCAFIDRHSPSPPPSAGLFYFDASYRPVPLEMQFVGVSERNIMARMNIMDEVCYQKVCVCGGGGGGGVGGCGSEMARKVGERCEGSV